jgi:hypothetical protein
LSRDETLILRIAQEIRTELESLQRLAEEFDSAPREVTDSYSVRARASILHDFYTGIERIFIRIADELNGGVPRSEQWHRQLLTDMTLELPGIRPAVVTVSLADSLGPFLRFRHLFRNLYGFVLDPERVSEVESRLPVAHALFVAEIKAFLTWMTGK